MNRHAFTLVELLVVLAIIGIVAGASTPLLVGLWQAETEVDPAREVLDLLKRARRTAVEEGASIIVSVDPARAHYWVRATASGAVLDEGELKLPVGTTISSTTERPTFTFFPSGTSFSDSLYVATSTGGTLITADLWTGVPRASP